MNEVLIYEWTRPDGTVLIRQLVSTASSTVILGYEDALWLQSEPEAVARWRRSEDQDWRPLRHDPVMDRWFA